MAFQAKSVFLIVLNFASIFFFSGIIFGCSALREMLLDENFYINRCNPGEKRCDGQELALHSAFTFASSAVAFSFMPGGFLLDAAGPFITVIAAGVLNVLSLWGMSMTKYIFLDSFDIFPFCLVGMAISGALIQLSGFSCAFLFPEHKNLLIAIASVLFDGSCLVFPVLRMIYLPQWAGAKTFGYTFGFFTGFSVFVFVLLSIAWFLNRKEAEASRQARASCSESDASPATGIASLPIFKQLQTLEFALIVLFTGIQLTQNNLFIGTVSSVNEEIAGHTNMQDKLVLVNTIVSFLIPMGFIAVPAVTATADRNGPVGCLQVTIVLALIFTTMQLIPVLYMQLVVAIIFAAYRAFLFSTIPMYNSHYFGVLKMGRMQGFCFLAGGVMCLSQKPLVVWTVKRMGSNYNYLLGIGLCASGILLVLAILLEFCERRRSSARQPLKSGTDGEGSFTDGGRALEAKREQ